MRYKANHNLLLPDGVTEISAGEEFEYDGDVSGFSDIVDPVGTPEIKPEGTGNNVPEGTEGACNESELYIRARAKGLKINNYHNMGIDKLKQRIVEAEKLESARNIAQQAIDAGTEEGKADD